MSASAEPEPAARAATSRSSRLNAVLRAPGLPRRRQLQTSAGLLQYTLSGSGPGIVLLSGAGVSLDGWRKLYPAIEQLGTVLAWNRFGVRGSDAPPQPAQDGAAVIASLRELIAHVALQPPYLLVGHSLGGLHANLFARLHPREVAAVLFLEATHPGDPAVGTHQETRLARALAKVFELPQRLFRANLRAEIEGAARTAGEVENAGPFPPVPVAVVTGGADPPKWLRPPEAVRAKRARQQELARLSPQGEHVIAARSGHFPQVSEPELVLSVLRRLLARATR